MPFRLVLIAAMLLGGAALAWFSLQANNAAPMANAAPAPTVKILVALQPLQAGTLLKDADLREQEVPPGSVNDSTVLADENSRAEIRGAMLRHYLDANQPLRRGDILRPRDRGFLAAVLAPGTRAVSIGVDATTGAAGLISPGDLVDVILTQEFARGETPIGRRVVAENVLSMVRVIAVDQQITQGAPTGSGQPGASSNRVASTVSLQVTPEQAAKVVVAGRLGRLTLTVRSIDGDPAVMQAAAAQPASSEPAQAPAPIPSQPISVFGSDVSAALSQDEPAANPRLRLIQGDTVSDVVFH